MGGCFDNAAASRPRPRPPALTPFQHHPVWHDEYSQLPYISDDVVKQVQVSLQQLQAPLRPGTVQQHLQCRRPQ
jgi:hypothetical protein